jgi:hypothetical protein
LQHDLPPTLSDSQVTSVQKQLKLTLLGLMKHPASIEYASTIAKQLTQLGAKEQEIIKAYPKPEDVRRIKKRQQVCKILFEKIFFIARIIVNDVFIAQRKQQLLMPQNEQK